MIYSAIGQAFEIGYQFIISPEFQAVITAVIGVVTAIAITSNKIKALKLVSTENKLAKKETDIAILQNEIRDLKAEVVASTKETQVLKAMFSKAFMNSRKLDPSTRLEIAQLSIEKAESGQVNQIKETVVQEAQKIIDTPIQQVKPASAFDRLME